MKNLLVVCAVTVATFPTALPSHADFVDGNTLMEWAGEYRRVRSGAGDALSQVYVRRLQVYVMGVHDAHGALFQPSSGQITFCTPAGATVDQVTYAVFRFLENHPEMAHESGSVLVVNALAAAFPCPG